MTKSYENTEGDKIVWNNKEFEKHKHEWIRRPIMKEKEVLEYLNIKKYQLSNLIKSSWIDKYLYQHSKWKNLQIWVYDRFEIIAFAHEVGLRT